MPMSALALKKQAWPLSTIFDGGKCWPLLLKSPAVLVAVFCYRGLVLATPTRRGQEFLHEPSTSVAADHLTPLRCHRLHHLDRQSAFCARERPRLRVGSSAVRVRKQLHVGNLCAPQTGSERFPQIVPLLFSVCYENGKKLMRIMLSTLDTFEVMGKRTYHPTVLNALTYSDDRDPPFEYKLSGDL